MIEDQILNEIDANWLEYNKNDKSKLGDEIINGYVNIIEDEIIAEYIDILNFYDTQYPDIKNDEITHYNLSKTIIINNLRDQLIEEIKKSKFFEKILKAYNDQKK